jgi:uncharacterized protein (UPF0303 family)
MARTHGPLVIDITLNGHQIFRFAMQGTGPDFDEWITRKRNVVDRFRHSSALVQSQIEFLGQRAADRYPVSILLKYTRKPTINANADILMFNR